jgi:hypothetical protein
MNTQDITDFDGADIIDVRDVIARVEELREELESLKSDAEFHEENDGKQSHRAALAKLDAWPTSEEGEELAKLEELLSELCGYGGDEQWEGNWYPVTLLNEDYFEEAMDNDMEELGYIPKNLPPFLTITVDYDVLKQDYSSVEFEGNTYYYR